MFDTPGFRAQLGRRIAETAAKFPTKSAAADVASVSLEQFNRWIAGDVKVPVEALWRLAQAGGVDFCWLCSGQDHRPAHVMQFRPAGRVLHESAMREVLMALAEVIATDGVVFAADKFADLTLALHDYLVERRAQDGAGADLSGIPNLIALAARAQRSPPR